MMLWQDGGVSFFRWTRSLAFSTDDFDLLAVSQQSVTDC